MEQGCLEVQKRDYMREWWGEGPILGLVDDIIYCADLLTDIANALWDGVATVFESFHSARAHRLIPR
jgi:hypothetical protein